MCGKTIIGIGLLMSLTHALADDWSNNAPLIANEVYLWHVSPEQREIADQNGRWLKDKLGVPLNQKRSISPLSEAAVIFGGRYESKPITKPFHDFGVEVPAIFAAYPSDTLGATPQTQESYDVMKHCLKKGTHEQQVICSVIAINVATEWARPDQKTLDLVNKDVMGPHNNQQTIMEVVGNKLLTTNIKDSMVLDPLSPEAIALSNKKEGITKTKESLVKAGTLIEMLNPTPYE